MLHFLFCLKLQLEDDSLSYPCLICYVAYVIDVINLVLSLIYL
jgi:hypothetical protein